MSTVARRVGVFAVKKGGFRGIACNADSAMSTGFATSSISSDTPTVVGIAAEGGSYLGPLPETRAPRATCFAS